MPSGLALLHKRLYSVNELNSLSICVCRSHSVLKTVTHYGNKNDDNKPKLYTTHLILYFALYNTTTWLVYLSFPVNDTHFVMRPVALFSRSKSLNGMNKNTNSGITA